MAAISEVTRYLETLIPIQLQEEYDNSGLLVGNKTEEVKSCLLCLDITEEVINEAIKNGDNLIIAHHPIIFKGLKSLTGKNEIERCIIQAIKNNIAIYAMHTNIDNITKGVSFKMAEKLGLENVKTLKPQKGNLFKIVVFVPEEHTEKVREAMFKAGAGNIGNYDKCSYNLSGQGTFRGGENTNPFVGKRGEIHFEPETRIETICPNYSLNKVIQEMIIAHPYEEVAYDIYPLENVNNTIGSGTIGELQEPATEIAFLNTIKEKFKCDRIRHTAILNKEIKKVALCGGSGAFLISNAMRSGADIFITADIKYHQFFEAEQKMLLADIGHYESEQYTLEIFYDLLIKKFTTFAIRFTNVNTNPINYL